MTQRAPGGGHGGTDPAEICCKEEQRGRNQRRLGGLGRALQDSRGLGTLSADAGDPGQRRKGQHGRKAKRMAGAEPREGSRCPSGGKGLRERQAQPLGEGSAADGLEAGGGGSLRVASIFSMK